MTLPARRRGRITLTLGAAAALLAGSLPAPAQQPSSGAPPAASAPANAPPEAGQTEKSAQSYSLGLIWGEELRNHGVRPDAISSARLAQGVHDAITGKVAVSDKDRENFKALAASVPEGNHKAAARFLAANGRKPGVVTTASGLEYQELKAGSGDSPRMGDSVVVNYRGTLLDGSEFDSSKRGEPATFVVGHVIPGWNEALVLMKAGAKWKLFIPPQLAYDLRSPTPSIPPGSMLLFEVELVSVKPASPPAPAQPPPK